jgi:Capsule polysaccharide biosynthesis protein
VDPDGLLTQWLLRGVVRRLNNLKISRVARTVAAAMPAPHGSPVIFFKASTGIDDLSWNSGFHLLASWALRLKGIPVVYFVCGAGMSSCVLGTDRNDVRREPPCRSCMYQSRVLYTGVPSMGDHLSGNSLPGSSARWFGMGRDRALEDALRNLSLNELADFEWSGDLRPPAPTGDRPILGGAQAESPKQQRRLPLGALCLPSMRWILRRHNLKDDEDTRFLLRRYMLSAWNVARQFSELLDAVSPRAVVVFNGQYFPEAVARHVARESGVRVITHEVGLQPASAFFTNGEATAYPIHIPAEFELTAEQNSRLDAYLEQRFQGKFTMAGMEFWPQMRGLGHEFLAKIQGFSQIVPVFTNVIFDTSQAHANTVFQDMFAWLDAALDVIRLHPETLFVIRAHPDEARLRKESRETVQGWIEANAADRLPNVEFIGPREFLSSYELIERAKFVMVYNSTIGLEASIMGKPVLSGGRARYTQLPTVFFPKTASEHRELMEQFLSTRAIAVPPEFARNARRFLYFQLFKTSLPFDEFLEPSVRKSQTRLRTFESKRLVDADALKTIVSGLEDRGDFLLPG